VTEVDSRRKGSKLKFLHYSQANGNNVEPNEMAECVLSVVCAL